MHNLTPKRKGTPVSELLTGLQERREKVETDLASIAQKAADENRKFSSDEQGKWDSAYAELEALDTRIQNVLEGEKRAKAIEDSFADLKAKPVTGPGAPEAQRNQATMTELRAFLRGDMGAPRLIEIMPTAAEARTLSKLSAGAGANTVPTSFYDQLVANLIETSAVLKAGVRILNTDSGETLQIPKTTGHSTAAIVAEAGTIGTSDPVFGQASLGAYKYGVLVQVSRELVTDAGFDLEGYLAMETGRALGNALGAHLITGTGTSQPRGILTDATLGITSGTGVAGAPTYDNLVDLYYSVIQPYRDNPSAAFLMKDTTVGVLRKIKDTTGQPIWSMGNIQQGVPATILGVPIYTDPFMPATAVNAKSIVFGDFSKYFVRLVGGVRFERSDEYAFNTDLVTFRALLRADAALIDLTGAVKYFVGAAT